MDVLVMPSLPISRPNLWKRSASEELSGNYTSTDKESSSIVLSETLSRISRLPRFICYYYELGVRFGRDRSYEAWEREKEGIGYGMEDWEEI